MRNTTAIVERTADPEAILRRFTRGNVQHPTYKALAELCKTVKTIFLCCYLSDEALRREIHEGLNVVETWNSANGFIFFCKGGEVASNRLDDQEVSVHALHLLQSCLIYVNTLILQRVLAEPDWMARMTSADIRGRRQCRGLLGRHRQLGGCPACEMRLSQIGGWASLVVWWTDSPAPGLKCQDRTTSS